MADVNVRVQRHRDALRRSGLRPVQIWVPDTRRADFEAEAHRQSRRVAESDRADPGVDDWLDAAAKDIKGRAG